MNSTLKVTLPSFCSGLSMREIRRSRQFEKDFKKCGGISPAFIEVLYCLIKDEKLPTKYRDHALTGNMKSFRDCHVKPDLVLIYRIVGEVVELHQIGSHSHIFG